MDKITYLAELAEGLARWVPERERQDILRYYAEYFDEAGLEREAEVVQELGDPWALASRLAVEGGYVSQEKANAWRPRRGGRKLWPLVLAGTLAAVVVVAVSVASLASGVGRLVGRYVRNMPTAQAVTVEEAEFGDIVRGDGPNAVWYEYDNIGGFWSMEDGTLECFTAIDADISLGNITIAASGDYTLAIQQSGNLGGYELDWEIQGDTLKIRDASSGNGSIGVGEMGSVLGKNALDVIITVPDGEFLSKIDLKTDLGNVYLSDLYVEVRAAAETSMGNVECYDLRVANKLNFKTDMGNVTLYVSEPCTGMDINVETSMGDVEVGMGCPEWTCAYEVETDLGRVTVDGVNRGTSAERKGDLSCKLNAGSDMGNVDVYFYGD